MKEEPLPPPVVTVTDPSRPDAPGDVLGSGSERAPWRPTRRQWQLLLAVVLVLAVAVPPVLVLRHRADDRRLDRRVLAGVSLSTDLQQQPGSGGSPVALTIRNDGPEAVTLLSVRVDREGYSTQRVDTVLPAGQGTTLQIPVDAACPTAVPVSGPTGVVLSLRTVRGQQTSVRVATTDSIFAEEYLFAQQDQCGLFPPEESLDGIAVGVTTAARVLRLQLTVSNRSNEPRTITSLTAGDGFRATLGRRLPIVVPSRNDNGSVDVPVRITVTNCLQALSRVRDQQGANVNVPYFLGDLSVGVSGDGQRNEGVLQLSDDLGPELLALTSEVCGATGA